MTKQNYYNKLERKYLGTTHNSAKKRQIAKTVIFPGDPLRAKWIARKYLKNAKLVNRIRAMYAYTGTYKGKKVSVMASGMGIPSASIYSYELFGYYDVDNIIRVGTCGSYSKRHKVGKLVASKKATSESFLAKSFKLKTLKNNSMAASKKLLALALETSKKLNFDLSLHNTHTSDNFYHYLGSAYYQSKKLSIVEMEAFAIYTTAKIFNKNSLTIATVVANHVSKDELSPAKRQSSLDNMVVLALEMAKKL